jgi:hypothetical protein
VELVGRDSVGLGRETLETTVVVSVGLSQEGRNRGGGVTVNTMRRWDEIGRGKKSRVHMHGSNGQRQCCQSFEGGHKNPQSPMAILCIPYQTTHPGSVHGLQALEGAGSVHGLTNEAISKRALACTRQLDHEFFEPHLAGLLDVAWRDESLEHDPVGS